MSETDRRQLLVNASHILHLHNVLDGFGHISARNAANPATFFMTGTAAALIRSPDEFTEYRIGDGSALDGREISPYSEHYIHAAIYARFPDVQSIVHSHATDVLPFTVSPDRRLTPVLHTAGFLGKNPPVWDIATAYCSHHIPHLLVNDYHLGQSLAAACEADALGPAFHRVTLQRGHGFVALGESIPTAAYSAIYTVENAAVLNQLYQSTSTEQIRFLSEEEIPACIEMDIACIPKVWPLWLEEIKKHALWR